jgi:hypothetical protein
VNYGVPRFARLALCISLLKSLHKLIAAYPAAGKRINLVPLGGGEKRGQSAAPFGLRRDAEKSSFGSHRSCAWCSREELYF